MLAGIIKRESESREGFGKHGFVGINRNNFLLVRLNRHAGRFKSFA